MCRTSDDGIYEREIVMLGCDDRQPKQIAHIRIRLDRLAEVRDRVLEASAPFGRVLAESGIPVERRDVCFLRVPAHPFVRERLDIGAPAYFGRRYTLAKISGEPIAHVIEIVR